MLPRHIPTRKAAMADDLDDVAVPDDLEDDILEDDVVDEAVDDLDGDALGDDVLDDDLDGDEVLGDEVGEDLDDVAVAVVADHPPEETEDEEEEEPEDEDVEASLDVILKERLVVEDEPEDDEVADVDDRSETTERVLPKQPDEFVCRSCFLVKHPSQLADKRKMLCRDCV
jgi:hypothetical protein